jgi:hypothetical protein
MKIRRWLLFAAGIALCSGKNNDDQGKLGC